MSGKTIAGSQLDLFFVEENREKEAVRLLGEMEARQKESWKTCWDWDGPRVGEPLTIDTCCVEVLEPGADVLETEGHTHPRVYAYMERCIALEELPDGRWICEIAMGEIDGCSWHKDGTKVILMVTDIWPPTGDIRKKQKEEEDSDAG